MLIDLHCHLDLYPNPKAIIDECEKRRMYVLSVTTTPSAWIITSSLSKDSDRIKTALGLHPQVVGERFQEIEMFDEFLHETKYVGEIGLDGGREYKQSWNRQVEVFSSLLKKCTHNGGRILSIHSRAAAAEVIKLLKMFPESGVPIFHWFSGSDTELKQAIALDAWFSVGVTMLKSNKGRDILRAIPRGRILTETDGPFTQINSHVQQPWDVEYAIVELSKIWKVSEVEAKEQVLDNLRVLTRII